MRIDLKEIYSLELTDRLEQYCPDNPENFGLSIRLMVAPEGSDSAESFDVLVCTPDWIKGYFSEEYGIWGRHMLIVSKYDHALILEKIARQIASCQGKDWDEVANRLGRFAAWDFEDYRPYVA